MTATAHRFETGETAFEVYERIDMDVMDGYYDGADQLDSFMILHDYLDANDYLIEAAEQHFADPIGETDESWDRASRWMDQLAADVDALLSARPIAVAGRDD